MTQERVRDPKGSERVDLEIAPDLIEIQVVQGFIREDAGVVDQDVDPAVAELAGGLSCSGILGDVDAGDHLGGEGIELWRRLSA